MTRAWLVACFILQWFFAFPLAAEPGRKGGERAVIFDCDGVLVDTEHLKFLAWQRALEEEGESFSLKQYIPLIGHSSKNILRGIEKLKDRQISARVIAAKNHHYRKLQRAGVIPIEDAVYFVHRLAKRKKALGIQMALASSAPRKEIFENLRQIGLIDVFDLIISGADDLKNYTDPEGTNKPKPYIYLEAAKRLGVKPESCLVFEDTEAGVVAASLAGMVVIAVPNDLTRQQDFSKADGLIDSCKNISLANLKRFNHRRN